MLQRTFSSQLLFCSFFLFVTRIQSEEILQLDAIDADNVTNIDNQTCEAKVNTYMFKMMVENFNEVSITHHSKSPFFDPILTEDFEFQE